MSPPGRSHETDVQSRFPPVEIFPDKVLNRHFVPGRRDHAGFILQRTALRPQSVENLVRHPSGPFVPHACLLSKSGRPLTLLPRHVRAAPPRVSRIRRTGAADTRRDCGRACLAGDRRWRLHATRPSARPRPARRARANQAVGGAPRAPGLSTRASRVRRCRGRARQVARRCRARDGLRPLAQGRNARRAAAGHVQRPHLDPPATPRGVADRDCGRLGRG